MKKWTKIQAKIYNILPLFLRRHANNIRLLPHYIGWRIHKDGHKHARDLLAPMRSKFHNCRCIVIGNGPSLNEMDLGILEDEYTFGLNRIYLLFEEWGFETTFLVSTNGFVLHQFADDLRNVGSLKFFNWLHRDPFNADSRTVFLCARPSQRINGNILKGYYSGAGTVTNLALEIAYFLGFSEVILIGVDHTYKETGESGLPVISQGSDQNHFSPNYFGKGTVWQLPNFHAMEHGYRMIRELYKQDERIIVDGTVGGKLDIFPKVNFRNYIDGSKYINKDKNQINVQR